MSNTDDDIIVDFTEHPCKWCAVTHDTFLCNCCHKYTCRDCYLGELEEGCVHRTKELAWDTGWNNESYSSLIKRILG